MSERRSQYLKCLRGTRYFKSSKGHKENSYIFVCLPRVLCLPKGKLLQSDSKDGETF